MPIMRIEPLTLYTKDQTGFAWRIVDATSLSLKTSENGFLTLTFPLRRPFGFSYEDIGLDFQVFVYSNRGDVAWHGRLESIEPSLTGKTSSMNVTAVGYWAAGYDEVKNGTISGSTPEACLATILTGGYVAQWSTTTTGLSTTGVTSYNYQTSNGGTDDLPVGDIVLQLYQAGSSSSQRVVPAIWENRQLVTTILASPPSPRYLVRRRNVAGIGLRRALSSVSPKVLVRYKDANGNLQRVNVADTATQNNLGVDFTGGGTVTTYNRTQIVDITGLSNGTSSTNATSLANSKLAVSKLVKSDSQAINISKKYCVIDLVEGQEIPLWKVRSGYYMQIPDLLPRPAEAGSGTAGGDAALLTTFYITQTEFKYTGAADNDMLTITPEASSNISDLNS